MCVAFRLWLAVRISDTDDFHFHFNTYTMHFNIYSHSLWSYLHTLLFILVLPIWFPEPPCWTSYLTSTWHGSSDCCVGKMFKGQCWQPSPCQPMLPFTRRRQRQMTLFDDVYFWRYVSWLFIIQRTGGRELGIHSGLFQACFRCWGPSRLSSDDRAGLDLHAA